MFSSRRPPRARRSASRSGPWRRRAPGPTARGPGSWCRGRRRRCAGPGTGSRWPRAVATVPALGSVAPPSTRNSVVLPAPLRPTRPTLSPARTSNDDAVDDALGVDLDGQVLDDQRHESLLCERFGPLQTSVRSSANDCRRAAGAVPARCSARARVVRRAVRRMRRFRRRPAPSRSRTSWVSSRVKPERLHHLDLRQSVDVGVGVEAEAAGRTPGRRDQTDLVVVADRAQRQPDALGDRADLVQLVRSGVGGRRSGLRIMSVARGQVARQALVELGARCVQPDDLGVGAMALELGDDRVEHRDRGAVPDVGVGQVDDDVRVSPRSSRTSGPARWSRRRRARR